MNPADDSVRSYQPGDWFGIVGERALVILPPTEKLRVAALWELVDGGAGFDVTLDALISGGLRELPAFVLVGTGEGETRVVIRGPARAVFRVGGETVQLEGSGTTTWVEQTLADVDRMTIVLQQGDALDGERETYVVDGGLFRISRLDEAPAHEGPDELAEEPAYEREFPLGEDEDDELDADDEDDADEPDEPDDEDHDEQWDHGGDPLGAPMVRSPEPPAWRPPPPPSTQPPTEAMAAPLPDTDHDGLTIGGAWQPPAAEPPGIPGQPPAPDVTVPVARLVISNGDVVDVDRVVVIGRAPEARRVDDTEQPRLVTVPSPHLEVSSTHIEVRPGSGADHGSAVVTDLGSTNGTVVVQPGLGPESLEPGITVQLIPGALIDLGDGVTIQVTSL